MPSIPTTASSAPSWRSDGTSGLAIVRDLETELEGLTASPATELTPAYRERLMALGADLQLAWTRPGVTPEARKRIVRTLIDEIIVQSRTTRSIS